MKNFAYGVLLCILIFATIAIGMEYGIDSGYSVITPLGIIALILIIIDENALL